MENLLLIHKVSVILFLLIYLVKTFLLLANRHQQLDQITKVTKVPEMIVSAAFLITGVWMFAEIGAIKQMQIFKLIAVFASIPLAIVGFKKKNKGLAALALLLIIAAYGLAEMSRKKPYPAKEISADANGIDIYKANCNSCHGEDGTKALGGAADLSKSMISKEEATTVIRMGKNNMAGFEGVLSAQQIDAVADYIQTLKK
jgi:mono/diheme cytochrome c family protein